MYQWVYREDVPAGEMVLIEEVEARFKDGWVDTPAKFGMKKEVVKEVIEEVEDDLDVMSKKDLELYAKEMFDVDIDRRKNNKTIVAEIRALEAN